MNAFDVGVMTKLAESRGERKYSRAKSHVAKGHEREKGRLQTKGRRAGGLLGMGITAYEVLGRRGKKARPAALLAIPVGVGLGHLAGERAALKRLETSQKREEHGHYAPFGKRASIIDDTAKHARTQLWATKRSMNTVKPVAHKPKVVASPAPKPPQVAPSVQTPVMQTPMAKESAARRAGAESAIKKLRAKKSVDDMGGPHQLWSGQKPERRRPGPENEPVPGSWRGHDF